MKYHETDNYSFLLGNNHYVYDHKEDENSLHLFVKSKPHSCKCPECGQESRKLHATYKRDLQDTPIHCKQTYLHANVYKYECENPSCACKVFTETLPFAKSSQVRTDALNSLILGVSMFLSNEGASKVLALLGVKVSNDTIQRLYDRIEFIDNPDVEEVGIDDVAIRKGQTYATAVYDLKGHHLIALLEGQDAETLTGWLKNHQKIRLVARDRASAYAAAINAVLPDCVQVADRFHLLQNLLEYLKDIFKAEMPSAVYIKDGKILEQAPEKIQREKEPDKKYLSTLHYDNSPPMNKWLNIIFKMMLDGHSDETIYFYIREQEGFTESMEQLARYIYLIGKNNFPGRIPFNAQYLIEYVMPPDVICFKRMKILKYLLTCDPKAQKNNELDKYIDLIKENFPAVLYAETVFKEFRTILMGNEPEKLDGFLEKYSNRCLASFCNGIKKDIAPVKNAISHPESSGFVEGNNNKFKPIKRIVYGRSGLVNLEKKCKLAFMPKTGKFSLQDLV